MGGKTRNFALAMLRFRQRLDIKIGIADKQLERWDRSGEVELSTEGILKAMEFDNEVT